MTSFAPHRLAALHRQTPVGETIKLERPRTYSAERWNDVVEGAGFSATGERLWTLADRIRPGMAMLICGLNPSPASADSMIPFGRPGNRFWPAMAGACLTAHSHDPDAMLRSDRIGMTDMVKRTTRRAAELAPGEYIEGLGRIERLARWLSPRVVVFVGLTGWRVAVDRKAIAGWQPTELGGRPVYLMPSTSGLNAHSQLPELIAHLQRAGEFGRSSVKSILE